MTDPAPNLRKQLADDIADAEAAITGANDELDRLATEVADWARKKERQIERRDQARRYLAMLPAEAPAAAEPAPASKPRAKPGEIEGAVLRLLDNGSWRSWRLAEIVMEAGYPNDSVRAVLRRLVKAARVVEREGLYSLAVTEQKDAAE